MTTHKVYVDTESLSKEELEQLLVDKDKEIKKLKISEKRYKNQYEFLDECLTKLQEENKKLEEENKKLIKDNNELMKKQNGLPY